MSDRPYCCPKCQSSLDLFVKDAHVYGVDPWHAILYDRLPNKGPTFKLMCTSCMLTSEDHASEHYQEMATILGVVLLENFTRGGYHVGKSEGKNTGSREGERTSP